MVEFTEISSKNLRKKFEVIIPAELISRNFKEKLEHKQKHSKYPGFRLGKAPLWVIQNDEKKLLESGDLKDSLFSDVVIRAAYGCCDEIKKELKITIFNKQERITDIDIDSYKDVIINGGNFKDAKFTFECELQPQIPVIKFEEIEVNRKVFEVTEDDINKEIDSFKAKRSTYEDAPEGYTAKEGDKVICDLYGKMDGKDFNGGRENNLEVEIGKHEIMNEIEESLIGMQAGEEKYVNVFFPDDYPDDAIKGKSANYMITVNSVRKTRKIETDEDLINYFKLKNREELVKIIKEKLSDECNTIVETEIKDEILELIEKYDDFEVPESIIENQREVLKKNSPELNEDELEKEALASSRSAVILGDFANRRGITISREDILNHIMRAIGGNQNYANYMLDLYKRSKEFAHSINVRILEEKVFNEMIEIVKKKEVSSSVEEILNKANKEVESNE